MTAADTQPVITPGISCLSDFVSKFIIVCGLWGVFWWNGMSADFKAGFFMGSMLWLMAPVQKYISYKWEQRA